MPPMHPKQLGICDKCQGQLIQRKDDNPETIKQRLEIYKQETQPLIDFYKQQGLLKDIKIIGPPEQMVDIILKMLEEVKKS